jgi:hypothetical protein
LNAWAKDCPPYNYEQNGANMRSLEKMLVEEQRKAAGH